MADDIATPPAGNDSTSEGKTQGAEAPPKQETPQVLMPADVKLLLDKVRDLEKDNKKYRDQRKEIDAANAKAQEEDAKKRGEFEKLYLEKSSKLEQLEPEITALRDSVEKILKTQLGALSPQDAAQFTELFGDITNPAAKLEKLAIWAKDKRLPGTFVDKTTQKPATSMTGNDPNVEALKRQLNTGSPQERLEARNKLQSMGEVQKI